MCNRTIVGAVAAAIGLVASVNGLRLWGAQQRLSSVLHSLLPQQSGFM